jgi:hypothetical protein
MTDPQFLTTMRITTIAALLLFFIPTIIAFVRKAKSRWLIFLLSFLLILPFSAVWSIFWLNFVLHIARYVFWVVALIWSLAGKKK